MKLKEARKKKSFSTDDLGSHSQVSPREITQIELGNIIPSVEYVRKIAHALEVDPMEIDEFKAVLEKEGKKG